MMSGNGELSVPPGFRFHPTDEELLYYYLRKKVSYESIDLDVIREVDLNKLEPWDLKDKCRIGSGPQNEWYFFSHKDKKYPTGTRTNRATTAGFWKATGRDKAIFHASSSNSNKRIGMRKTLVFYTGRAPHGQKTDWIMHEYRLDVELEHDHQHKHQHHHHNHNINNSHSHHQQEDGWVVCRVFKKKNQISRSSSGFFPHQEDQDQEQEHYLSHINSAAAAPPLDHHHLMMNKQNLQMHPSLLHHQHLHHYNNNNNPNFDASMHLPHLFSPESAPSGPVPPSFNSNTCMDNIECSQNLLSLTSSGGAATASGLSSLQPSERLNADWSLLDKLLASHQTSQTKLANSSMGLGIGSLQLAAAAAAMGSNFNQKFTFPYLGEPDHIMKFSK